MFSRGSEDSVLLLNTGAVFSVQLPFFFYPILYDLRSFWWLAELWNSVLYDLFFLDLLYFWNG